MTELFGGVPGTPAYYAAFDPSPLIRARMAWSLGCPAVAEAEDLLYRLATEDSHARVRRCGLEALVERRQGYKRPPKNYPLAASASHSDKRIRYATALLLATHGNSAVDQMFRDLDPGKVPSSENLQQALTWALASCWKSPTRDIHERVLKLATAILNRTSNTELRLQAVRLIMLALGDYHLVGASPEVYTGYSLSPAPQAAKPRALDDLLEALLSILPSGDTRLDEEASRLLAM